MPTNTREFTRMLNCAAREVIDAHLQNRDVTPELVPGHLEEHLRLLVSVTANLGEYGPVSADARNLSEAAIETLGLIQAHEKEVAYREYLRERAAVLKPTPLAPPSAAPGADQAG